MNEPKPDEITVPLDDRLPPHYRETIDQLFGRNCVLESENRLLLADNEALLDLVRLLLMPRLSDAQLRRKRDRLLRVKELRVH